MEGISTLFNSFKEFIWDIIGYFLPDAYLIIVISTCVKQDFLFNFHLHNERDEYYTLTLLIISYLIGHAVYGLSTFKEKIRGKKSYKKRIELEIAKEENFLIVNDLLKERYSKLGLNYCFENISIRDKRRIVMGLVPEADHKVYTFTFRSHLSNHIGNISVIIGTMGIIMTFGTIFFSKLSLFNSQPRYILLYLILILSYIFLRKTRDRFYKVSISLPFSLYFSKALDNVTKQ
ncbi:hypothetical protein [uncultured Pontibacter sp.]|uniref:hypothetical protein n=1 Tax=uncultured Pontibacter sp. TaxID=453356 RepID=UPI0026119899|nr:hypothetical protein [uncultured Pontibacter sp.]